MNKLFSTIYRGSDLPDIDQMQAEWERSLTVCRQCVACKLAVDMTPILIAMREAVTNALEHGCRKTPSRLCAVAMSCEGGRLRVSVSDEGDGIPETALRRTAEEAGLEERGRGILMMRGFSSEMYQTNPNNVTMLFGTK